MRRLRRAAAVRAAAWREAVAGVGRGDVAPGPLGGIPAAPQRQWEPVPLGPDEGTVPAWWPEPHDPDPYVFGPRR